MGPGVAWFDEWGKRAGEPVSDGELLPGVEEGLAGGA